MSTRLDCHVCLTPNNHTHHDDIMLHNVGQVNQPKNLPIKDTTVGPLFVQQEPKVSPP